MKSISSVSLTRGEARRGFCDVQSKFSRCWPLCESSFRPTHGRQIQVAARRPKDPTIAPVIPIGDPREGKAIDLMRYLASQRIIYVGTRITDAVATNVVAQLLAMELQDPDAEIAMYINSGGGIPFALMAIIDTMAILKCSVSTVALGACMSQSTLLLAAGTKGRRFAMPNARIMMHQPQGGAEGTIHDVKIQATELNRTMRVIQAMYVDFTGSTQEKVEEEMDRDRFMKPSEAVELGLIDGVI